MEYHQVPELLVAAGAEQVKLDHVRKVIVQSSGSKFTLSFGNREFVLNESVLLQALQFQSEIVQMEKDKLSRIHENMKMVAVGVLNLEQTPNKEVKVEIDMAGPAVPTTPGMPRRGLL